MNRRNKRVDLTRGIRAGKNIQIGKKTTPNTKLKLYSTTIRPYIVNKSTKNKMAGAHKEKIAVKLLKGHNGIVNNKKGS